MINKYILLLLSFLTLSFANVLYAQKIEFTLQTGHTSAITSLQLSDDNETLYSTEVNSRNVFSWQTFTGKKIKTESLKIETPQNETKQNAAIILRDSLLKIYMADPSNITNMNAYMKAANDAVPENLNDMKIEKYIFPIIIVKGDTTYSVGVNTINWNTVNNPKKTHYLYEIGLFKDFVAILDGGDKLIAIIEKGNIVVTNFKGKKLAAYKFGKAAITAACVSKNKEFLVVGNELGQIITINLKTKQHVANYTGLNKAIERIYYSKDGNIIYIVKDNEILTYNYKTNLSKKLNTKTEMKSIAIDSVLSDSVVFFRYLTDKAFFEAKWNIKNNNLNVKEIIYYDKNITFLTYKASITQNWDTMRGIGVKLGLQCIIINKNGVEEVIPNTNLISSITSIKLNKVYKYITIATQEGKLHHYDIATKKELFTSVILSPNSYLHALQNGYFFGTKRIFNSINCSIDDKIIPNYQMDAEYNRPDIVIKQIPQHDLLLASAIENSYKKRKKNTGTKSKISSVLLLQVEKEKTVNGIINIKIKTSSQNSTIKNITLFVNGVNDNVVIAGNSKSIDMPYTIELADGKNDIEIFAEDNEGAFSNKISITENYKSKIKPNLYLICIGSGSFLQADKNLNYASKDANDVCTVFSNSKKYGTINKLLFTNNSVNTGVVTEIENLLKSAKKNDYVVLFYAGHGILNKDMDYYLSTYNVDFASPEKEGIEYAKIEGVIKNCNARQKVFFIDACHSGDIEKESVKQTESTAISNTDVVFRSGIKTTLSQNELSLLLSKELFASGSSSSGTSIIGASMGSQFALESNMWNNGVFTHSLLLGLGTTKKCGKADYNHDKKVMLDELEYFVSKSVEELTNGKQKPTTRSENLISNMRLK